MAISSTVSGARDPVVGNDSLCDEFANLKMAQSSHSTFMYILVIEQFANLNMAIEFVSFPMNDGDFP